MQDKGCYVLGMTVNCPQHRQIEGLVMLDEYGVSTRYYGPTDYRGSRIRVTYRGKHKFISGVADDHRAAVHEAIPYLVDNVSMVEDVRYVADTESGRGSVYLVTVSLMERGA